jgi:hypothetical protein
MLIMSLRFSIFNALFLAALLLGVLPFARAQSAGPEQQILFTTPEGQVVTNAPVPATQAPQPEAPSDFPSESSTLSVLNEPSPVAAYPRPAPIFVPQNNDTFDPMDPFGERKRMKLSTTAEIMHVPTMAQIFGISQSDVFNDGQTNRLTAGNLNSNILYSADTPSDEQSAEDATWQKILAGRTGANASSENQLVADKKKNSPGIWSDIFNAPPEDNSLFGNQDRNPNEIVAPISADSTATAQPAWASFLAQPIVPPPPSQTISSSDSSFDSPFAPSRTSSSLATLPQLPVTPSAPGQTYNNNSTPTPPPSWEPKPAPWLSPVPPLGTMAQRKF